MNQVGPGDVRLVCPSGSYLELKTMSQAQEEADWDKELAVLIGTQCWAILSCMGDSESTVRQNHHHQMKKKNKREVDKWRKYCFGYFCSLSLSWNMEERAPCVSGGAKKVQTSQSHGLDPWTEKHKGNVCTVRFFKLCARSGKSRKVNVALSQRSCEQNNNLLWSKLAENGRAGLRQSPVR